MTNIYFVRHAESDHSIHQDDIRPLTQKGVNDRIWVTEFLSDKNITKLCSSPYKRSVDTIQDFANKNELSIELIEDFRERTVSNKDIWIEDFAEFTKLQWQDHNYKLSGGESFNDVQIRNINALNKIISKNPNSNIAIGTHGMALSTIYNYYDNKFGYTEFERIIPIMPWIVHIVFNGSKVVQIKEYFR